MAKSKRSLVLLAEVEKPEVIEQKEVDVELRDVRGEAREADDRKMLASIGGKGFRRPCDSQLPSWAC